MASSKVLKEYRIWFWFFFEMIIPVVIVVSVWPIAKYFLSRPHSFELTLSSGNLLPLGALILIGALIDVALREKSYKSGHFSAFIIVFGITLCVFYFSIGAIMKAVSFDFDISQIGTIVDDGRMTLFSKISLAAIILSCVYSIFLKLAFHYFEKKG